MPSSQADVAYRDARDDVLNESWDGFARDREGRMWGLIYAATVAITFGLSITGFANAWWFFGLFTVPVLGFLTVWIPSGLVAPHAKTVVAVLLGAGFVAFLITDALVSVPILESWSLQQWALLAEGSLGLAFAVALRLHIWYRLAES